MNPEETLDLRSLAEVDSPAVVKGALRRFRRKVITTGALVLLAIACLAGGIVWAMVTGKTLGEQIDSAPGAGIGTVYSEENVTIVLRRVARLDEGLGLHLLVAAPEARPGQQHFFRTEGIRNGDFRGGSKTGDAYLVIPPSEDGLIEMRLLRRHGCDPPPEGGLCRSEPELLFSFDIDLVALGVPENIWSDGG